MGKCEQKQADDEEQSDEKRSDDEKQFDKERFDNEEQSNEEHSDNEEQSDEEPNNKQSDDEEHRQSNNDDEINFAEDDYESSISNLNSLVRYLNNATIHEVWSVKTIEQNKEHFMVISDNANHLCTCILLVSKGLVCRNIFSVMTNSDKAMFHIRLIPDRWYNERPLIIKKNLQLQFVGNVQQIGLIPCMNTR